MRPGKISPIWKVKDQRPQNYWLCFASFNVWRIESLLNWEKPNHMLCILIHSLPSYKTSFNQPSFALCPILFVVALSWPIEIVFCRKSIFENHNELSIHLFLNYYFLFMYMYICVHMPLCDYVCVSALPTEVRREHWIFRSWSYRWLWAARLGCWIVHTINH